MRVTPPPTFYRSPLLQEVLNT